MNGRSLGDAVLLHGVDRDRIPFLPLAALLVAVDGEGPTSGSRLRVAGERLYGVEEGGCRGCLLRVRRPVMISTRVRRMNGVPYLPLSDLVRALEGRLVVERGGDVYRIAAAACLWCILQPEPCRPRR